MSRNARGDGSRLRQNHQIARGGTRRSFFRLLLLPAALFGCASLPSGPSVLALSGTGKDFIQFRNDDAQCRQFANAELGGVTPNQAAISSGAGSAAVGTALGAAAGAAIGGGQGAAIGAGTGLAAGGLVGTSTASNSGYAAQQRYDMSYIQCMYANGHRVPVYGQTVESTPSQAPRAADIPPPPPGQPPPPPPDATRP